MSFALFFSGQGTQHPDMLPWLADDEGVIDMQQRLGVSDWRRSLADPNWASNNANAQTLLTGLALAAWAQLMPMVPRPAAIAGYSVGELAAFSVAGVFDGATAMALAPLRASAMDRSAAREPGGLLAVNGLTVSAMEKLRAETSLALAIRNGLDSFVLGGPVAAIEQAERLATGRGAQCTRLRINVASHTPWMRNAAEGFSQALSKVAVHKPRIVLFSNACDRVFDAESAKTALSAQIAQTVRWDECMENVAARQVRCVLEIGPGQALTRMWNKAYPSVPARACDDFRSASAIADWLRAHAGD